MNRRRFCTGLVLLAAVGVLIVLTMAGPMQAADSPISAVHLTLTAKPTSMVVTWRADKVSADGIVKVWPARLGAAPENAQGLITAKPAQHTFNYARETVNVYDAVLEGLAPDTSYNYVISCGGTTTPVYSFQTPVGDESAPFTFAVLGDSRGNYELNGKLLKMAREAGARFVLYTGDMTDSGTQPEWNLWFRGVAETLPLLPIMPLLGNHEMLSKSYFQQFVLPSADEKNYLFTYGMAQFGVLYDGDEKLILEQTLPWLTASFAASKSPWKFIALHKPPYASIPYIIDTLKDGVTKTAEDSGVAMVFSGHRHTYERTYPLLGGRQAENGVVYMISGGAGAPLDETVGTFYTAKAAAVNHFVILNVTANNILCVVKNADGSVIDEFTVTPRH